MDAENIQRWDYHVERMPMSIGVLSSIDADLGRAGDDGWELMCVVPTSLLMETDHVGGPTSNSSVTELMLWFKRPRREA